MQGRHKRCDPLRNALGAELQTAREAALGRGRDRRTIRTKSVELLPAPHDKPDPELFDAFDDPPVVRKAHHRNASVQPPADGFGGKADRERR